MTRQRFHFLPATAAGFLALILLVACSRNEERVLRGFTMGTNYQIRIPSLPAGLRAEDLKNEIDASLKEFNALLSTYDSSSELSRFNRAPAGKPFTLSPLTAQVLRDSLKMNALSDGAFDPTVPPLLRLWGFGAGADVRPFKTRPSSSEVERARRLLGRRHLLLKDDTLTKLRPGVELDFSAIAKGTAVDRVFELLRARGLTSMMVEIGGEVRVAGRRGGKAWRIGLERPRYDGSRDILRVAEIQDRAVASSGDYRIFFEIDGRRYAHIIDPRTGEPAHSRVRAATVIGPDCQTADALATSLLVLGHEAGLRLCEELKEFECMLVMGQDVQEPGSANQTVEPGQEQQEEFEVVLSSGMAKYIREHPRK